MMDQATQIISEQLLKDSSDFFDYRTLLKAKKLVENSRLNVSFQKGSLERYFIISGIVEDGGKSESKFHYKNRDGMIHHKSNCTCLEWTEDDHCSHTVALYLKFHLNLSSSDDKDIDIKHLSLMSAGRGVHTESYGTILKSASNLIGSFPNSSFSSLQYLLMNKKTINFPVVTHFENVLHVNIVPATSIQEFEHFQWAHEKYVPIFSIINDQQEIKQVSIFDFLYIFDWENGKSYHLTDDLKQIIKKLITNGPIFDINFLFNLLSPIKENGQIEFSINGHRYTDIQTEEVNFQVAIDKSKRSKHLDISFQLVDQEELPTYLPEFFKIVTSENGFLSSFRTKSDAAKFIIQLCHSLELKNNEYKKHCHSSRAKKDLIFWSETVKNGTDYPFFDPIQNKIYLFDIEKFTNVFLNFFNNFGESAVRFSYFSPATRKIYFEIPRNIVFNGISSFYTLCNELKVKVFYKDKKLNYWNSQISFKRVQSSLNWFDLEMEVNQQDLEVIQGAEIGKNFIITKDNNLVLLNPKENDLVRFLQKYSKFDKKKEEDTRWNTKKFMLSLKRARIFELFELKKYGIEGALTPEEIELCERLKDLKELPKYDVPERFQKIARQYQIHGFNWLSFLHENKFGACLADDMGLGKTLQTIMFLHSIESKVNKVLIVCPVSILVNWQNEFKKFADTDIDVFYGDNRVIREDSKFIITTYGIMKKEFDGKFADVHFDILVLDEVQHLKNIKSLGANAARGINADFRICLTGTPVENDLSEFYNILDLSVPGIWGELSFIRSAQSKKARLNARKTVKPFILRRTKSQVLFELPEKVESYMYLNFTEDEQEKYKGHLDEIKNRLQNAPKGRKYGQILKSLLELRQMCLWQKKPHLQSTKVNFLIENLEQLVEEGHKTIVFSQFTTYLDIIEDKVKERGWKFSRIDGMKSFKQRATEIDKFQEGDSTVFLISLKAGGVGLNLTAASYIFLMDPWWNPAVESQAVDRAYRIGQKNKLTVYRPIIKGSIEEKVLVLQNKKKELFNDLMADDDESYFSGKLNMNDFEKLLE